MNRRILRGLKVSEFIHPDELDNRQRVVENSKLQKALAKAAEWCKLAVDPLTQGTFVQVYESNSPKLNRIVREVCQILDMPKVPDVYICHLMDINITPMGDDNHNSYLVVPDYVLRYSDEDMLYYNVGNAITMILANHVGLTTMASYMPGGGLIELPKILFVAYLHSADSTSDRGGLLACQSFAAMARAHLFDLGIPPSQSKKFFTTDKEAEIFVEKYLAEQQKIVNNYNALIAKAARFVQRMSYIEAPANKMIREIFKWYKAADGYEAVILNHS